MLYLQESQFAQSVVPLFAAYGTFPSLCPFTLGEEGGEDKEVDGRGKRPSQGSENNL